MKINNERCEVTALPYISPSLLSCDFSRLGEELSALEQNGADWAHIDVMDGHFVNNITVGAPVIKCLRKCSGLVFDVHLMIENPLAVIDDFLDAGADIITFHLEACKNTDEAVEIIEKIMRGGAKPSVSIKPHTPVEDVFLLLDRLYMVLIMTVEPGFGGQAFIDSTLPKIKTLRRETERRGLDLIIQVDGGINSETIRLAALHGANAFAVGSAVFNAGGKKAAIEKLRALADCSTHD